MQVRQSFNRGEISPFHAGRTDLEKYQEGLRLTHHFIANQNPKRGRIRRALAIIGGAFLGVSMLWALCWGMAIACVVAGGSIEVCGL